MKIWEHERSGNDKAEIQEVIEERRFLLRGTPKMRGDGGLYHGDSLFIHLRGDVRRHGVFVFRFIPGLCVREQCVQRKRREQ